MPRASALLLRVSLFFSRLNRTVFTSPHAFKEDKSFKFVLPKRGAKCLNKRVPHKLAYISGTNYLTDLVHISN